MVLEVIDLYGFDFHEGILILPRGDKPHPLVVYPHGGPHSISLAAWSRISHALLTLSGFAVLLVNYRGSIGFGDNFVHSLLGNCGDFDVKDVHNSVLNILRKVENIDENNIFVMGSSHGGFLASNLIGQYPGFYKACVAINPVLNVCSMFDLSDIADWAAVEGLGVDVDWCKMPTIEQRQKMHECSPVAHVHKVITPYMLAIGAKDLRVVDHSRSFIRNLLARDIPTKVLIYPNSNHCIEEVECNADLMINAVLWFYLHSHHT
ncbi:unnamed protein product [Dracunculus medinensis]|uniref:Peptidase_S9 domain-containing protein n=1 Tax=Dracunculus medinensis TaxID=318479 RepID=A0A0N4UQF4_DRAME|nr:unnamed protein product [Dracunculus medinensis]